MRSGSVYPAPFQAIRNVHKSHAMLRRVKESRERAFVEILLHKGGRPLKVIKRHAFESFIG